MTILKSERGIEPKPPYTIEIWETGWRGDDYCITFMEEGPLRIFM